VATGRPSHLALALHAAVACLLARSAPGAAAEGVPRIPATRENVFESELIDIKWLGPEGKDLLAYTKRGRLHRSNNSGATWADLTDHLGEGQLVSRLHQSPADPNIVVAVGSDMAHFASQDAGITWRRISLQSGGKIRIFWLHSNRPTWALVSYWTSACSWSGQQPSTDKESSTEGPCAHMLYATKDLGKIFTRVSSHVVQFSWGGGAQRDRIYFTHQLAKDSHQKKFTRWQSGVDLSATDDMGQTFKTLVPDGNKFVVSQNYILVAKTIDTLRQEVQLQVSSDGLKFDPAVLPQALSQKSYIVLDASEGAVVLHVDHGRGVGHIYVSDRAGLRYSLSLTNNVRRRGGCDFDKVMNLKGIFLANYREEDGGTQSRPPAPGNAAAGDPEPTDSEDGLSTMSQTDRNVMRYLKELVTVSSKDQSQNRRLQAESRVRTVISFNKGGSWSYLKPPAVDSLNKEIDCSHDKCYLHLHGMTDFDRSFVPFYSYHNAVGIIMGTGNVGPYLSYDVNDTNTYVSRDGGLTWMEAHKGVYIYEFGNYGGLLMMADWLQATQTTIFSWNEGESWWKIRLSDKPMMVTNILTEPWAKTTNFVVFGKIKDSAKGLLYHVDFDAMQKRTCKGIASAGGSDSDYEIWSASDGTSTAPCLLGEQVLYTRRKQMAECFNNEKSEWPRKSKHCLCTAEDFECELGFARDVGSFECVMRSPSEAQQGPCVAGARINAYRRVAGDTCRGGWRPPLFEMQCTTAPPQTTVHSDWGVPVASLIVVVGFAGVMCGLTRCRFADDSRYSGYSGAGLPRVPAGASAARAVRAAARNSGMSGDAKGSEMQYRGV